MSAQPPNVAATEAAAINSFMPGALVASLFADLFVAMIGYFHGVCVKVMTVSVVAVFGLVLVFMF